LVETNDDSAKIRVDVFPFAPKRQERGQNAAQAYAWAHRGVRAELWPAFAP